MLVATSNGRKRERAAVVTFFMHPVNIDCQPWRHHCGWEYSGVTSITNQRLSATATKEAEVIAATFLKGPESCPTIRCQPTRSGVLVNTALYLDHRLCASHTLRRQHFGCTRTVRTLARHTRRLTASVVHADTLVCAKSTVVLLVSSCRNLLKQQYNLNNSSTNTTNVQLLLSSLA